MKIDRITKIRDHRIFKEFDWPQELTSFKRKNLIYGWNGTGKSTISNIFRSIEKVTNITDGIVELEISKKLVSGANLTDEKLPQVRVFNQDFVAENVFTDDDTVNPIFFLGEKNIEMQKKVIELKKKYEQAKIISNEHNNELNIAEKFFNELIGGNVALISPLLASNSENNPYNKYNADRCIMKYEDMSELTGREINSKILSDAQFIEVRKKITETPKNRLDKIEYEYPDFEKIADNVRYLLKKTNNSDGNDELYGFSENSLSWMQLGLKEHVRGGDYSKECYFCGQPFPEGRLQTIENCFDLDYEELLNEIENQKNKIIFECERIESFKLPDGSLLYSVFKSDYIKIANSIISNNEIIITFLKNIFDVLEQKKSNPFHEIGFNLEVPKISNEIFTMLNNLIELHNKEIMKHVDRIDDARTAIEESIIAKNMNEFRHRRHELNEIKKALKFNNESISSMENEIDSYEGHQVPADELNKDICSYLGRDDIKLEVHQNGYSIRRNDSPATNLSEGEKTAIAFLYFLKSLEESTFMLSEGIVVIDDPVSSLDSNSQFSAFGFMRERVEKAGQLFILTHNHSFFRQVKYWFNYKKGENYFYMLNNKIINYGRTANIVKLDDLLADFESEYHYLFSLVYKAANLEMENNNLVSESQGKLGLNELEKYYPLPNIARRLLEAFLAFRYPTFSGELHRKLAAVNFDKHRKVKIERFLNTYSHADQIFEPEHDSSIFGETKPILKDLLCLIDSEDHQHFEQMKQLVVGSVSSDNLK